MNNPTTTKKRILIIGTSSKIAQRFIRMSPKTYDIYGTYGSRPNDSLSDNNQYQVDLHSNEQISAFLDKVSTITFDAVLFFAASYIQDPDINEDYIDAYQQALQLNVVSIITITKRLFLADASKLFLFGDSGLSHPKKSYTSYSISKFGVADVTRLLAVELAPHTSTFCLRLGPTLKKEAIATESYYNRGLMKTPRPADGLINLLYFLISEENFNATGCVIDYDGGAYIKR